MSDIQLVKILLYISLAVIMAHFRQYVLSIWQALNFHYKIAVVFGDSVAMRVIILPTFTSLTL